MNSLREFSSRFIVAASVLFALPLAAWSADHEYYGIYLQGNKAGYMHTSRDEKATWHGKPAVRTDTETSISLYVLGNASQSVSKTISYTDPKSGLPLAMTNRSEASGRVSEVSATYDAKGVQFVADIQGNKKSGTALLKPGEKYLVDPTAALDAKKLPPIGTVIAGVSFSPDILRLVPEKITITRKESVTVGDKPATEAYVVEDRSDMGTVTQFITESGDTLLLRFNLGMEARRETKERALAAITASDIAKQKDLALVVSIIPTGLGVPKASRAAQVHYTVSGISADLPPSDNRQAVTYTGTGDARQATVVINATPLPDTANLARFVKPEDAPEAIRPYLLPSDYVSSGDPVFVGLAKTIVGSETDIAKAARKISDYTHRKITADSSIAVLRTASDIDKEPRGVCRDYTTYFMAIARAAGIPTRAGVGVALVNGTFLYHAWPEVWTGEKTGWIALEPTWGRPYADATHIKLAQGEITDLYRVADDMGRYKIEITGAN